MKLIAAFLAAALVFAACTSETKEDCAQAIPVPVNVTQDAPDTPSGI